MLKLDGSVANLLRIYEASTAWEREDGKAYYAQQRANIASMASLYKMDTMACIGAFAALSPNNDEAGNYRDLKRCIEHLDNDMALVIVSTYPDNARKALKMLRGQAHPDEVLFGPKTLAFYHNTLDPHDPYWVTVDGHMVSCWLGRRVLLRRRTEIDDQRESADINRKEYEIIATDLRAAAKKVRLLPCQFQATIWVTWKRLNRIRYQPQLKLTLEEANI